VGRLAKERTGLGPAATISLVVIAVGLVGLLAFGIISAIDPFGSTTVDRSGPALLERIQRLEKFEAAEGNFNETVDLETDSNFLPSFIQGERVTAIVSGKVRATVDFSHLDQDAVKVSDDRTTIHLTLPDPVLSDPDIQESSSRVVSRDRGIVDRLEDVFAGNPTDDQPVYKAAESKLATAAKQSDLVETARTNTERWLRTFLGAAGFDRVDITWTKAPT
jgi:hypothetical protein